MKKTMAFIHVIIPCYNVEKHLEQAVYSVLNQPCKEIDIVLVDDGSPGKTPQLCDKLEAREPRVHVIHKENGGVSSARNTGIDYILKSYANNLDQQYLAFLDGDDIWSPDFFTSEVMEVFAKNYDSIAFRSRTCTFDLSRCIPPVACTACERTDNDSFWTRLNYHFGAVLHACKFVQEHRIRFKENLRIAEDTVFQMYTCYYAKHVWQDERILYVYRKNPVSVFNTREFGIPHFVPIIDGFIETDTELNLSPACGRSVHTIGSTLARRYLHELVTEHFQIGGASEELDELFRVKPHYLRIMAPDSLDDSQLQDYTVSLRNEYQRKRRTLRLRGIILYAIRVARSIPLINTCAERMIYKELTLIPESIHRKEI